MLQSFRTSVSMRPLMTIIFSFILLQTFQLKSQAIVDIEAQGIKKVTIGGTTSWSIEWIQNSSTGVVEREVTIYYTGVTSPTKLYADAITQTGGWEFLMGSTGSNSWSSAACRAAAGNLKNNTGSNILSTKIWIRNTSTSYSTYDNTITFSLGSCNTSAGSLTFTVEVKNVNNTIYTWSEPQNAPIDSFYNTSTNWTPTRSTKSTSDILVVNLANGTDRSTVIHMDNVADEISQFYIYPRNIVTFRCNNSNNSGSWKIGNTTSSVSGEDLFVDSLAKFKFDGGTLNIDIQNGNTALFKSNLEVYSGTLNFIGQGTHTFYKDIAIPGGTLKFQPSSGTNTLNLKGTNTKLTGTGGTLYVDSLMNVVIGNGTTSTYTLERVLPIISNLRIAANTTIVSNSPNNNIYNSYPNLKNFTPYLQLKATPKANSNAFGQILKIPSTSNINGAVLFEIFNNRERSYRALGVPFTNGFILSQLADDIDITGTANSDNADSFTTSCSWCTSSLFQWNETSGAWSGYQSLSSVTTVPLGKGTLVFFRGDKGNGLGNPNATANEKVVDFIGTLSYGNKSITLQNNGTSLKGYNLVSNPYPCTIDLREVYHSNSSVIKPQFYMYDAIGKTYNIWDSTGKTNSSPDPTLIGTTKFKDANNRNKTKLLAPGAAAFFIVNSANTAVSVNFIEDHKFETAKSTTKHFASGVQEEHSTQCNKIGATLRFQNNIQPEQDDFLIEFDNSLSSNNKDELDVNKLYAYLGFGSLTDDNSWLSIDRRDKIANPGESKSIPLKVAYPKDAPTAMEISFNYCESGNYRYDVKLVDKFTQTSTDITDGTSYTFNASNVDEKKSDRFELVFTGREQSNTANISKNHFTVYPNPTENNLNVLDPNHKITSIEVVNQFGQLQFAQTVIKGNNIHEIKTTNLSNGLYFINIIYTDGRETQKIIKY